MRAAIVRRFWLAVSALHYFGGAIEEMQAEADGLKHTDFPCDRCARSQWNEHMRGVTMLRAWRIT